MNIQGILVFLIRLVSAVFAIVSTAMGIGQHNNVIILLGLLMFLASALPKNASMGISSKYRILVYIVCLIGSVIAVRT